MRFINRNNMQHHAIGVNPWPRWCFNLWAQGCGDQIATNDYADDFVDTPRWKFNLWKIRGPILERIFIHLWWWV